MWPKFLSLSLPLYRRPSRKTASRHRPAFHRPLLEALEDRTLLSPLLTVANVAVSGSNGAVVTNTGNWDPTTEAGLTASAGTITAYDNGTWNWSETTPMGAARTAPVTITSFGVSSKLEKTIKLAQVRNFCRPTKTVA